MNQQPDNQEKNKKTLQTRDNHAVEIRRDFHQQFFREKRTQFAPALEDPSQLNILGGNQSSTLQIKPVSEEDKQLKTFIEQTLKQNFVIDQLPELVENINSSDVFKQHYGVIGIRKVLSVDVPPIQPIIDGNLVPRLIEFMKTELRPHLQLEAAWALTNVASGTTYQTQTIIDKGGIPLFVALLSSKHAEIAEQAIWAIGNIAGDGSMYRDMILKCNGIDPLINIIRTTKNKNTIKQGTWALSNLCRGKPLPEYRYVANALPVFCQVMINEMDKEIITDAAWALSYLSDGDSERIQTLIDTGVVPSLIQNLKCNVLTILIPTIRIIGNIVTGTDVQTNIVLQAGGLDILFNLLASNKKQAVKSEICWALSNIAAGTQEQIHFLVSNEAYIKILLQLIEKDVVEIKREAAWVISNATHKGHYEDIFTLITKYKILEYFIPLLDSQDTKTLAVVLESIKNILNVGSEHYIINEENIFLLELEKLGGTKKIESLQYHQSEQIYQKSLFILEKYYEIEEPI